jgi:chromosome segregation ATPase
VDRTLSLAGRSLEELRAAVEVYRRRIALKAKLDAAPGLRARRQELEKQIRQADAALAAAEKRHAETVAPLRAQIDVLQQQIQEAEQARLELARTCPDEALRDQKADVQRQITETQNRLARVRDIIKACESRAKMTRDEAASLALYPAKQEETLALAEQHEAKAREYEKEAAGLVKRLAELEKQMGAVQQSMLEP